MAYTRRKVEMEKAASLGLKGVEISVGPAIMPVATNGTRRSRRRVVEAASDTHLSHEWTSQDAAIYEKTTLDTGNLTAPSLGKHEKTGVQKSNTPQMIDRGMWSGAVNMIQGSQKSKARSC